MILCKNILDNEKKFYSKFLEYSIINVNIIPPISNINFDFRKIKNAVAKSNSKKSKIIKKCVIIKISRKIKEK